MKNIKELLSIVEKNFQTKDEVKTEIFELNGIKYEVLLPTRAETSQIFFSKKNNGNETIKELYDWLRPHIYRMFQLKELSLQAKEAGYIKTHYEIIDMLFSPDEITKIIQYVMEKVCSNNFFKSEIEFQKKQ